MCSLTIECVLLPAHNETLATSAAVHPPLSSHQLPPPIQAAVLLLSLPPPTLCVALSLSQLIHLRLWCLLPENLCVRVCVCVCVCARDILHSHVCLSGRYIGAYPHANTHTHIHTHTHHHRPRTCCTHRVLRVKLSRRHASCGSVRVAVLSTRLTSVRRCRTTIGRHGNGVSIYCA